MSNILYRAQMAHVYLQSFASSWTKQNLIDTLYQAAAEVNPDDFVNIAPHTGYKS